MHELASEFGVKLVVSLFADGVRMSWGSSRSRLGAAHLPSGRPGMVADATSCCEVKLEEGGCYNRWFLGYLGPVQLQALKMMGQTRNWH